MISSKKTKCPSGYILRNSYKSKRGKLVKSRCIHKTGLFSNGNSNNKTSQMVKQSRRRSSKILSFSKKHGLPVRERCHEGQTLRSGYTRKSSKGNRSSIVPPKCITKRGNMKTPTRTEKQKSNRNTIIMIDDDHTLSKFGYSDIQHKTRDERMIALTTLINHFIPIKGQMQTYTYLIRALNARYILNRNTSPKVAKIFRMDQKTISKMYKDLKKKESNK